MGVTDRAGEGPWPSASGDLGRRLPLGLGAGSAAQGLSDEDELADWMTSGFSSLPFACSVPSALCFARDSLPR